MNSRNNSCPTQTTTEDQQSQLAPDVEEDPLARYVLSPFDYIDVPGILKSIPTCPIQRTTKT